MKKPASLLTLWLAACGQERTGPENGSAGGVVGAARAAPRAESGPYAAKNVLMWVADDSVDRRPGARSDSLCK